MGKMASFGKILECFSLSSPAGSCSCFCMNSMDDQAEGLGQDIESKPLIPSDNKQVMRLKDFIGGTHQTLAFQLKPKMVTLRVAMHCQGCARRVEKHILKMDGTNACYSFLVSSSFNSFNLSLSVHEQNENRTADELPISTNFEVSLFCFPWKKRGKNPPDENELVYGFNFQNLIGKNDRSDLLQNRPGEQDGGGDWRYNPFRSSGERVQGQVCRAMECLRANCRKWLTNIKSSIRVTHLQLRSSRELAPQQRKGRLKKNLYVFLLIDDYYSGMSTTGSEECAAEKVDCALGNESSSPFFHVALYSRVRFCTDVSMTGKIDCSIAQKLEIICIIEIGMHH